MKTISAKLLAWYDKHHRTLPWRVTPDDQAQGQRADPYHVWLSEIMLQQTTVEAVKSYYQKFLKNWPDIFALAHASEEDVLKAWAGLGYYSRARNLKKCADLIVKEYQGIFPDTTKALRALPGIGDYTAAAIAAIAFERHNAVVDGNVERVVSRLYTIETMLPKARIEIREKTQDITPQKRAGDFAQSMMDLGAMICTPKKPKCTLCPLEKDCHAAKKGNAECYPVKPLKKERPQRVGSAFIAVSKDNCIYLEKRHEKGLLANMTQVPNHFHEISLKQKTYLPPFAADWQKTGQAHHIFTHFSLILDVYLALNVDKSQAGNGWWAPIETLEGEALPTVMKKAIHTALPALFKKNNTK